MSDVFTEALIYGLGLCFSFWLMGRFRRVDFAAGARGNGRWIGLAGLCDAGSPVSKLGSCTYNPVVIPVIKRAGLVLSVFSGWQFFKELGIADNVIAATCRVLILYLPVTVWQAAATIAGMALAFYLTRDQVHVEVAQ